MSDIIQLLPDNIANQIAAGEVIQRPASVVKELIENAVDAGATKIELHIKDAGKTSIQLIDNGKGMSEMDARMCFERHATSKLKTADDLFNLSTKGFRGEALASIAAIAHVDLETKTEESSVGTKVTIQGSKVTKQEPIARTTGTSITVKNLFFNVPARRNFLKSDNVETKHIIEEFNRIALTHPEIGFKFSHNGNVLHDLHPAGLRKRIVDLHGTNFNVKLVPVEEETDIVKIHGFVGKPEFARKTRGEQYFFVNQRFFKDNYLNHAVNAAFDHLIPSKTYPSYFLYLTVKPSAIDVNIHPTKTEIKFEEDRNIYSILRSAVKLALGVHNISPTLDFEHEPQFDLPNAMRNQPISEPQIKVDPTYNPFKDTSKPPGSGSGHHNFKPLRPNKEEWENFYEIEETDKTPQHSSLPLEMDENKESIEVQETLILHHKYIVAPVKSGVLYIYIQRARERILYDELMGQFLRQPIHAQQLLFPIEIPFNQTEKMEWENHTTSIERLGFSWDWNLNTLVLSGAPSFLSSEHIEDCIKSLVNKLSFDDIDKGELAHEMIATLASTGSRGAIKNLSQADQASFIQQLFSCEDHQYTPNGKKIMATYSINDINKLF